MEISSVFLEKSLLTHTRRQTDNKRIRWQEESHWMCQLRWAIWTYNNMVRTKIQWYRTFVFLHIAPYLLCLPHLQLTAVGHCCVWFLKQTEQYKPSTYSIIFQFAIWNYIHVKSMVIFCNWPLHKRFLFSQNLKLICTCTLGCLKITFQFVASIFFKTALCSTRNEED